MTLFFGRSLVHADIMCAKKSAVLSRLDKKRPNGLTRIP